MDNSLCLRCGDAGHMAAECRRGGNTQGLSLKHRPLL
jgi:ribosomal protein L40E